MLRKRRNLNYYLIVFIKTKVKSMIRREFLLGKKSVQLHISIWIWWVLTLALWLIQRKGKVFKNLLLTKSSKLIARRLLTERPVRVERRRIFFTSLVWGSVVVSLNDPVRFLQRWLVAIVASVRFIIGLISLNKIN